MKGILLIGLFVTACSTVESRRSGPPVAVMVAKRSLQDFQGCFAQKTANLQVVYLPRANGGSFSAGAGPQRYISWVVDVDDLGPDRRVTVYALNSKVARGSVLPAVEACL